MNTATSYLCIRPTVIILAEIRNEKVFVVSVSYKNVCYLCCLLYDLHN